MKKFAAVLLLITSLTLLCTSPAISYVNWLSGKWYYTLKGEDIVDGIKLKIDERGLIKVYSDWSYGDEHLRRYELDANGKISEPTISYFFNYSVSQNRRFDAPYYYRFGRNVYFTYDTVIDGENVTFSWEFRRDREHYAHGDVKVRFGNTGEIVNARFTAEREHVDDKDYWFSIGSGCNTGYGALLLLSLIPILGLRLKTKASDDKRNK